MLAAVQVNFFVYEYAGYSISTGPSASEGDLAVRCDHHMY
jgi:hypothetical protein